MRLARPTPSLVTSFLRFLGSGAFNTLVTYALYLVLLRWLPYQASFSLAYASGIALAYVLNRYWVFQKPGGRSGPVLVALVYGLQYLMSLGLVTAWVQGLELPVQLAPLFAAAATVPIVFALNRMVFADRTAHVRHAPDGGRAAGWLSGVWARRSGLAFAVLVLLPLLSLYLNAVSWLRYGFDLPFFDDWRAYDTWDVDSLHWPYLFRPLNDTLTPIGLMLDALAQRYLDGNSVAYQFLSMVAVLGSLLWLQWALLRNVLQSRLAAAFCFVFTLLMLQPGSYWGRENLAYHQALPLVFILTAVWLSIGARGSRVWVMPVNAMLGLLAGLTYISGAFGAVAAGGGMLGAALLWRQREPGFAPMRGGCALLAGGLIASALQVWYVIVPQKGGTHMGGKALALPNELDFWLFYLGKLGRSLLLDASSPGVSLVLVMCVCGVAAGLFAWGTRLAMHRDTSVRTARFFVVYAAIACLVVAYLMLVAAGRTHFRPEEVKAPLDVFTYGFTRFHFFWATLVWPWLVAGLLLVFDGLRSPRLCRARPYLLAAAAACSIGGIAWSGGFDHATAHRTEAGVRHHTVACLHEQLQKDERVFCSEFNLPDLTPAFAYARHIKASFVRYFPLLPVPTGSQAFAPWFRLSQQPDPLVYRNATPTDSGAVRPQDDPQILVSVGRPRDMGRCLTLDVQGAISMSRPDTATLFYRLPGQTDFVDEQAKSIALAPPVPGNGPTPFFFRIDSMYGLADELRLDPVGGRQEFTLTELEVRCRLMLREVFQFPIFSARNARTPGDLTNLVALPSVPGGFAAAQDPRIAMRIDKPYEMRTCSLLELEAVYKVERDDEAQLFYWPRGATGFSEKHSAVQKVAAQEDLQAITFRVSSPNGFADTVRFDPVTQAQQLQFSDITLRCLRRVVRARH